MLPVCIGIGNRHDAELMANRFVINLDFGKKSEILCIVNFIPEIRI